MPTTAEEVYKNIDFTSIKESIFLERENNQIEKYNHQEAELNFYTKYRDEANKVLEVARKNNIIKRNNETILTIAIPKNQRFVSEKEYAKYLMVAKVKFGLEWKVETFNSAKCTRCWNHFDHLNKDDICDRCEKVINTISS